MRPATASSRWSAPADALPAAELAVLRARDAVEEARLVAPDDARDALEEARLAVPEERFAVERLADDEPLELFFRALVPELDFDAVERPLERLAPEVPLLLALDPEPELDEPPDDDPALLLGWGILFSFVVDRGGPIAP